MVRSWHIPFSNIYIHNTRVYINTVSTYNVIHKRQYCRGGKWSIRTRATPV